MIDGSRIEDSLELDGQQECRSADLNGRDQVCGLLAGRHVNRDNFETRHATKRRDWIKGAIIHVAAW